MHLSQATRVGGVGLLTLVATSGIGRQAHGLFVPRFREEFGPSLAGGAGLLRQRRAAQPPW